MRAAYLIVTILLAIDVLLGGLACVAVAEPIASTFERVGVPMILAPALGVAKLLAVPGLFARGRPRLREWVYAGLVYEFGGATLLHLSVHDPVANTAAPAVALSLTVVSYALAHRLAPGESAPSPDVLPS